MFPAATRFVRPVSPFPKAKMASDKPHAPFVLGIDIGTTTIKVSLVEEDTRRVLHTLSRETKASTPSDLGPLGSEQDVHKICTALQFCVSRLPKEHQQRVARIGVSGQMHGMLLWLQGEAWKQNQFGRYEMEDVSVLFTWQDGRCSSEFLSTLPQPDSHLRISTGQGCTTLFWLHRNRPDLLDHYDRVGTVQDLVVAMLCGLDKPVMSVQNAASWGYFDTTTRTWNIEKLKQANFPVHLLPEVKPAGFIAGKLASNWYNIPAGIPVGVALGDMQCSVFSTLTKDTDAVMNISTSAQLSFIMPEGFTPSNLDLQSAIEYFPYFNHRYLAVAASLNGGNVLAAFVRMLQQWTHELGLGVPEDKIWEKILSLAMDESAAEADLVIVPLLFGERHIANQRACVSNIDSLNISLGKVSRALCRGIINNLLNMMSRDHLLAAGIQRIVGSGSALTRNAVMKNEVEIQYDLPVEYGAGSDAAVGVALAMLAFSKPDSETQA